jgi:hypothetical protein
MMQRVGVAELELVVEVVVDEPVAEHNVTWEHETDVTVAVIDPVASACKVKMVEQSVAVTVLQDELEDVVD